MARKGFPLNQYLPNDYWDFWGQEHTPVLYIRKPTLMIAIWRGSGFWLDG